MAEIFNNRICVFANELIIFNPKTQVGSEDGFIPEGTYYSMARNGQLIVLRRGIPGCPALVDFETMRKDVKKEYIVLNQKKGISGSNITNPSFLSIKQMPFP